MNNFSFPFEVNNKNTIEGFFDGLSMESSGFYPFGINEFWHGGIHITPKSDGQIHSAKDIQNIADGHIVAYRINKSHIYTTYDNPKEKSCITTPHSTSFVLVKHTLEYPANSYNKLPIFSLYMHLLPWDGYTHGDKKGSQGTALDKRTYIVKDTANDQGVFAPDVKGANGRAKYLNDSGVLVLYPCGSELELEIPKEGKKRAKVLNVLSGKPIRNSNSLGTVWLNDLELQAVDSDASSQQTSTEEKPQINTPLNTSLYIVKNSSKDEQAFAKGILGANGRRELSGGDVLMLYPRGSKLEVETPKKGDERAKVVRVLSGKPHYNHGTVYLDDVTAKHALTPNVSAHGREEKTAPEFLGKISYIVNYYNTDIETFAFGVNEKNQKILVKGLRGRANTADRKSATVLYNHGSELVLEPHKKGAEWAKVKDVISGEPPHWKDPNKQQHGYVWLKALDKHTIKPEFDEVITPDTPIHIKKGALIGYLGEVNTTRTPSNNYQLHWEIFTGKNLKSFIGKAREFAKTEKQTAKTVLHIPKGTKLFSKFKEEVTDGKLIKETGIEVLETQGDYTKIKTLGLVATKTSKELGKYNKKTKTFAGNPKLFSDINGVSITEPFTLVTSYTKGKKVTKDTLHTVLYPHNANKTLWIKNTKLGKFPDIKFLKEAVEYWDDYPIQMTPMNQTEQDNYHNTKDIQKKHTDHQGTLWYKLTITEEQAVTKAYINSQDINHHVPEEFIQFDGINAQASDDGSLYEDPDNYFKQRFASLDKPPEPNVGNLRLLLKPFARKVFNYLDANHDGTISLQEARIGLKDPYIQKKLAHLITQHESEWIGDLNRWRYVKKYMSIARPHNWEHLKTTVQHNAWWDKVKGKVEGFPKEDAYYFHPAGFVGNFLGGDACEITLEQMKDIFPQGNILRMQSAIDEINNNLVAYKLDTRLRKAHFFAQVRIEAGPRFRFLENLNYGVPALKASFSFYRKNPEKAKKHAYKAKLIANHAYADENRAEGLKLGNIYESDGYKYIGRGLKQVTGRYNYNNFNKEYPKVWHDDDVDFMKNPELLSDDPKYAVRSAVWFWLNDDLYKKADSGATEKDVLSITNVINEGLAPKKKRLRYNEFIGYDKIKGTYNVFKC